MIEKFFTYAIIGVVITLMMSFFNNASKANPVKNYDGDDVLKLPLLYGIIGLLSFIAGLAIIIYGLMDYNPESILPQLFLFLLFGGLGGILILQQWVVKLILTEKEIIKITMFGQKKVIKWKEIVTVRFNKVSLELKIQSKETKIKCHQHLVGFHVLVYRLKKETGRTEDQMGIPKL
jgi:hypothetical protein